VCEEEDLLWNRKLSASAQRQGGGREEAAEGAVNTPQGPEFRLWPCILYNKGSRFP